VKLGERRQTHARALRRRTGRHVTVDEEPYTRNFLEVFEQKHEARAPLRDRGHARHPDRKLRRDPLAEGRLDLPEPHRVGKRSGADLPARKLGVEGLRKRPRLALARPALGFSFQL